MKHNCLVSFFYASNSLGCLDFELSLQSAKYQDLTAVMLVAKNIVSQQPIYKRQTD